MRPRRRTGAAPRLGKLLGQVVFHHPMIGAPRCPATPPHRLCWRPMPTVAVICGSRSDLPTLKGCFDVLDSYGIGWEASVISAHRQADALHAYVAEAEASGVQALHRCRRSCRTPARGAGQPDRPPGDRHPPRRWVAWRRRRALLGRPDAAGRAGGERRDRQRRAPRTPATWRLASSPSPIPRSPSVWRPSAPSRRSRRSCGSTRGPDVIDRYALPELREIFGERRKLELWLRIELLAVEALAEAGVVPDVDWRRIREEVGGGRSGSGARDRARVAARRHRLPPLGDRAPRPGGALAAPRPDELRRPRHRHRGRAARRDRGRRGRAGPTRRGRPAPGHPASGHADGRAQPRDPRRADHLRLQGRRLVCRAHPRRRAPCARARGDQRRLDLGRGRDARERQRRGRAPRARRARPRRRSGSRPRS